jgi:hypothetical protein
LRPIIRAAEGGVGFSKNAGNYALSLYPTQLATMMKVMTKLGQMLLNINILKKQVRKPYFPHWRYDYYTTW